MNYRRILPGTVAVAMLSACGSSEPVAEATGTASAEDAMVPDTIAEASETVPAASAQAALATNARGFVDAAAAIDRFEIESSRLATTMAKDATVKSFAEMMVDDHAKSNADLKTAAAEAKPAIAVDPKLTPEQQTDLDRLQAAGNGFDRLYGQKQIAAHQKALALFQTYSADGDSPPLKNFATKTVPIVSAHLDRARSLPQ